MIQRLTPHKVIVAREYLEEVNKKLRSVDLAPGDLAKTFATSNINEKDARK